jgi:hypothetical protein
MKRRVKPQIAQISQITDLEGVPVWVHTAALFPPPFPTERTAVRPTLIKSVSSVVSIPRYFLLTVPTFSSAAA